MGPKIIIGVLPVWKTGKCARCGKDSDKCIPITFSRTHSVLMCHLCYRKWQTIVMRDDNPWKVGRK